MEWCKDNHSNCKMQIIDKIKVKGNYNHVFLLKILAFPIIFVTLHYEKDIVCLPWEYLS